MIINRLGSAKSKRASSYFTGVAWQDPIIEAPAPSRVRALKVSFEPGARTAWHTHPLGQTLHILSGIGRVQIAGEPVREVRAGDTIYFGPNEKHWHGASPDIAMVHLAIQESDEDGRSIDWLEPVSDAEYTAPAAPL